ncbi:ParA family protein [Priestia sp. 179-F W1.4 NHS]|uniref:ParA family protein n=1 Tax=Priestia sp. 179-F W1.4 NHS TaxID=3374296 RepID=UPI003879DAF3
MRVISFLSFKGGVGRTTVVSNLAMELAIMGKKVLIIDLDPQANLSLGFLGTDEYIKQVNNKNTILEFLTNTDFDAVEALNGDKIKDIILHPKSINEDIQNFSTSSRIDLIISSLEMISTSLEEQHILKLSNLMDKLKGSYDVILIDCSAVLNFINKLAILVSDCYVIPSHPSYISTLGIPITIDYIRSTCTDYFREPPVLLGVLFNRVNMYGGEPIERDKKYIKDIQQMEIPIFDSFLPSSLKLLTDLYDTGIPLFFDTNSMRYSMKTTPIRAAALEIINKSKI